MVSWASCGALALWLIAGCAGSVAQAPKLAAAPAAAPADKPAAITDIQVSGTGAAVQIEVMTNVKVAYSLVRRATPPRLFLQLTGTTLAGPERVISVNRGAVTTVKSFPLGANAGVEVFLSDEATYHVEGRGAGIVLNVSPKDIAAAGSAAERQAQTAPAADAPVAPVVPPTPVVTAIAVEEPAAVAPAAEIAAPAVAVAPGPRVLTAIDVKKQADGLVVTLQGNGPLKHDYFLVEGRSLVVDLAGVGNKVKPKNMNVGDAWVSRIRIGEHEQPKRYTRVVFDLKKLGEHRVEGVDNRIVVSFGAAALAAAAPVPTVGRAAAMTALNTVGQISCRPLDAVTRLEIRTAVKPDFTVVDSGDPAKVIVEIANADIAEKDTRTIDLAAQNLEVVKVTAFPYAKGDVRFVRVVAQLRRPVPFRATAEENRVLVDFEKFVAPAAAAPVAAAPTAAPVKAPAPAAAPAAAPVAVVEAPAADPAVAPVVAAAAVVFTGRRLSLDFKDADVNDILRLISEVSGLNFVAGPEVKGMVSIKLTDVPWDLALDLILKTNVPQLAQVRESDNIMRVTTTDKMMDEEQRRRRIEEDKKKTIDAQKANDPVFQKTFAISYIESSRMGEFVGKLEKFKSSQGIIQFDERTKNIIVWDTAAKLVELERVILSWDAPTPAVMVEARIVEVSSNFGQSVGVQWNASGVKDPAHGNATSYAFPNSVGIGGQQGSGPVGPGNYMVNLPAAVSTGGIGFSFGHIANTLSLDLRLSAGENLGKVKILSNPKVLVVQSQRAVINLGSQLPIPKTDASGNRTVEWKDVGITLDVLPQITNDKRVFMEIKIEKSSQGENVQTTEGAMFSINTSRAQSKVLIADGETTVIGGIFIEENTGSTDSIPGLSKIPVLGWLFKNKATKENRRELMIFITPRIVVM